MMKKYILLVLLIILLTQKNNIAQNISYGFGIEPYGTIGKRSQVSAAVQANIKVKPIRQVEIEFRPGFALPVSDFAGGEVGAFIKLYPNILNWYFTISHIWHWNIPKEAGMHNGINGGLYKLPGLGIGYKFDNLSIESSYYSPYPKNLAGSKLTGIVFLNFSWSWELL